MEKPAVVTVEQFSLLELAARGAGRAVLVGHVRRLFPSVEAARTAVAEGRIGSIRRIEAYEGVRWSWTARSDFPVRSSAGGVLYDLGSHLLDMALYICRLDDLSPGAVSVKVVRLERWPAREPSHEVVADLVLRAPSAEVPVLIRLSRREPLANVIRVRGDRGELLVPAWHSRTVLLRTNGSSQRLTVDPRSDHTATSQGCFVEEHLEAWRAWALGQEDSPLRGSYWMSEVASLLLAEEPVGRGKSNATYVRNTADYLAHLLTSDDGALRSFGVVHHLAEFSSHSWADFVEPVASAMGFCPSYRSIVLRPDRVGGKGLLRSAFRHLCMFLPADWQDRVEGLYAAARRRYPPREVRGNEAGLHSTLHQTVEFTSHTLPGWSPKFDLRAALEEIIAWIRRAGYVSVA